MEKRTKSIAASHSLVVQKDVSTTTLYKIQKGSIRILYKGQRGYHSCEPYDNTIPILGSPSKHIKPHQNHMMQWSSGLKRLHARHAGPCKGRCSRIRNLAVMHGSMAACWTAPCLEVFYACLQRNAQGGLYIVSDHPSFGGIKMKI